jgi:hypothetical protein
MACPTPKEERLMAQTASGDRPALVAPRAERAENPFAGDLAVRQSSGGGGVVAVEQQRAIAEVQARMLIARANPRNPIRAMEQILNDCTRPTLAEKATFQYARGGTDIAGPTIRLAEAIAQRWGNIASGIKELSRQNGYSECVAYAWDLESGYYDERQFQIRHWRDTKGGGYAVTDERDIYEIIANFGQRRKRAVLLTVIPGDVVEAAQDQCERTMRAGAEVTPERIQKLVEAFATFGVEPHQIEARIQRRLDAIRPAQVVQLGKIFNSLNDGMSTAADWFEPTAEGEPAPAGEAAAKDPPPRRRGRPPGKATAPPASAAPEPGNPAPASPPSPPAPSPEPQPEQQRQPARVSFD